MRPSAPSIPLTRGRLWLTVIGFGTFCALVHSAMIGLSLYFDDDVPVTDWPYLSLLGEGFVTWYTWALLGIPIFHTVRWLVGRRLRIFALFAIHVGAGGLFLTVYISLMSLVYVVRDHLIQDPAAPIPTEATGWLTYLEVFVHQLVYFFAVYLGIIATCYAFLYYRPALKASQLEGRLTRAKLQALQMQLHPHFLFNALNSISVLVHRDPDTADRMISRLSDLLRTSLSSDGRQKVPLREELEFLDKYAEIELIRFQNRLRIEKDIEPDVASASVPTMVLQPLVENSIKHGIARSSTAGWIGIGAWREGETVVLEVSDDGPGTAGPPEKLLGRGVGLTNVRERLEQLYGDNQTFEMESRRALGAKMGLPDTETGLVVRIRIPFEEEADDSRRTDPGPRATGKVRKSKGVSESNRGSRIRPASRK